MKSSVADPIQGCRHDRGCAVDLSLNLSATGELVTMLSGYRDYQRGSWNQRWHRQLLRQPLEG